MTADFQPAARRPAPPLPLALLLVPLLAALLLTLFAWPQARSGPRDLPVGVAGPPEAVAAIEAELGERASGIEPATYAGAAAAREAIVDREVYGALVAEPDGITLLTAPAASPAVSQLLEQAAGTGTDSGDQATAVVEVVPGSPDDPRGAGFTSSLLPLLLVGVLTGALAVLLRRGFAGTAGFITGASALAGLAAIAVIQGWLGILDGGWLLNAGAVALAVLAISLTAAGLMSLLGYVAGIGVTAATLILVGNPWSGVSSAPELLPAPVGAIGQVLPPGAAGELLRGTAFFDGAGTGGALGVLLVWTVLGAAALAAGKLRGRADGSVPERQSSPSSAA